MRILAIAFATLIATGLMAGTAFAGSPAIQAPEPASLALLAVGVGGVALVRKLRRRK